MTIRHFHCAKEGETYGKIKKFTTRIMKRIKPKTKAGIKGGKST